MNSKGKTEFKLPKMGESITEGTILNWIVSEGESFQEGDILVEVGTDKVDNEVPAPFSGTLPWKPNMELMILSKLVR